MRNVLADRADVDVIYAIGPDIAPAAHAVLVLGAAPLIPLAGVAPYTPPFGQRHLPFDAASGRVLLVLQEAAGNVGAVGLCPQPVSPKWCASDFLKHAGRHAEDFDAARSLSCLLRGSASDCARDLPVRNVRVGHWLREMRHVSSLENVSYLGLFVAPFRILMSV